jgi:hypothetical protein
MVKFKILIVGDSFAASADQASWTNLNGQYQVTNLSQAGSSEYRIVKTLKQAIAQSWDHVIVVHTSPNRIYVEHNPLHQNSNTHQHSDLIFQDVENHRGDQFADHVCWWFENIFELEQAEFMHQLLIEKAQQITAHVPATHISFFDINSTVENLHWIWKKHPGTINHLDNIGNELVMKHLLAKL